jgi:hypothetical protein
MHPNAALIERLYSGLDLHDARAMAACYHANASFHDIAFDLTGRDEIAAMWRMIVRGDIRVTIAEIRADDHEGVARIVDEYTFGDTGRRVRNPIESKFRFRDGLIVKHDDDCDPKAWAAMALGGVKGFMAGRLRFLRARAARKKLDAFKRAAPAAVPLAAR